MRLDCAPHLNLVTGANASGKTSLLESLYVLGRGRSFRSRNLREVTQRGAEVLRIVAQLDTSDGRRSTLGVERSGTELQARINGTTTRSLAELARHMPVLLLNPDSHRLLEDGPKLRRRFMDWGLFHSESGFLETWQRYRIALRNRNAALRTQAAPRLLNAWDGELATAATRLDPWRETFCKALNSALERLSAAILGQGMVEVAYRRGWSLERPEWGFADWLRNGQELDRHSGYTRIGPHRADFALRVAGRSPSEALSRGQQKLLVIALVLAQAELYRQRVGDACIVLIDDLPAELDAANRMRVMQALQGLDVQLFLTAIEPNLLESAAWSTTRVFCLEDGKLRA